ncbi:MAG: relaxase/mobilization nuclease domain-containing protein [Clostridia bacterium]|nr:relaxase/mobilization nuclease domain-containing protein [Clostridia bacterium]
MATTNLIPLHVGKNCTAGSSIARVIQYVKNPEKTQGESLVTGYGCNPALADAEFMYIKKYLERTGRYRGKDDLIAYHMRQSFLPGEITPEEANRLGRGNCRSRNSLYVHGVIIRQGPSPPETNEGPEGAICDHHQ